MSAFRHPHNAAVRPLDEELAEMGLNPDAVLSEIDRNTAMLEEGPVPMDLSGLQEGDESPRSMMQYGESLLGEKKKCKGKKKESDKDDDDADEERNGGSDGDDGYEGMGEGEEPLFTEGDDEDDDESCDNAFPQGKGKKGRGRGMGVGKGKGPVGRQAKGEAIDPDIQYLIDEGWELDEVSFGLTRKARGAEARKAKRERAKEYKKHRGEAKLDAKINRRKNRVKIKRVNTAKLRKWGAKGLAKLHAMGKRIITRKPKKKGEWTDRIANIREELEGTNPFDGGDISIDENIVEETYSPVVEAALNAAQTAMYLGEIFDAMGDEAGKVLLKLSDKAVDLAEAIEANDGGEPTEEQEKHVGTVLEAVIKSLAEHEDRGSPSLDEAIGVAMVMEGLGTWDELVEYQAKGQKLPAGKTASPDQSVAGKYLKAINMAMQKMDSEAAMKAAEVVLKKHKVMDAKGLPVTSISTMTDVLRTVFYLSQITGLKAPSWMYKGKSKPWFVGSGDTDKPGGATVDKKLAGALKALGAPAGLLKAMGEEFGVDMEALAEEDFAEAV